MSLNEQVGGSDTLESCAKNRGPTESRSGTFGSLHDAAKNTLSTLLSFTESPIGSKDK